MKRQLVIFAKTPRIGAVKTRLAKDVGAVEAWRFYVRTMESVVRRLAADGRWECRLAVTPGRARWPVGIQRMPQGSGDLGDRMHRVMQAMPAGPVVIVGTDIPDIAPDHVAQAFTALGRHDAVFGPADDGGYWLIGLRRCPFTPRLAGPVRWSTEHALSDTIELLGPRVRVAMLETLTDVDDGPSLARWRAKNSARR